MSGPIDDKKSDAPVIPDTGIYVVCGPVFQPRTSITAAGIGVRCGLQVEDMYVDGGTFGRFVFEEIHSSGKRYVDEASGQTDNIQRAGVLEWGRMRRQILSPDWRRFSSSATRLGVGKLTITAPDQHVVGTDFSGGSESQTVVLPGSRSSAGLEWSPTTRLRIRAEFDFGLQFTVDSLDTAEREKRNISRIALQIGTSLSFGFGDVSARQLETGKPLNNFESIQILLTEFGMNTFTGVVTDLFVTDAQQQGNQVISNATGETATTAPRSTEDLNAIQAVLPIMDSRGEMLKNFTQLPSWAQWAAIVGTAGRDLGYFFGGVAHHRNAWADTNMLFDMALLKAQVPGQWYHLITRGVALAEIGALSLFGDRDGDKTKAGIGGAFTALLFPVDPQDAGYVRATYYDYAPYTLLHIDDKDSVRALFRMGSETMLFDTGADRGAATDPATGHRVTFNEEMQLAAPHIYLPNVLVRSGAMDGALGKDDPPVTVGVQWSIAYEMQRDVVRLGLAAGGGVEMEFNNLIPSPGIFGSLDAHVAIDLSDVFSLRAGYLLRGTYHDEHTSREHAPYVGLGITNF